MTSNKILNIGIIGCGKFGAGVSKNKQYKYNHINIIKEFKNLNIISICDLKKIALLDLKKVKFFYDSSQLLSNNKIDLVIIVTNNSNHYRLINLCIKYKVKYIICEKPLATTYDHYKKILKSKKKIITNYSRRHLDVFLELKRKIKNNFLGDLNLVNITFNRGLINNGCHYFDLLCWIFDKNIKIEKLKLKKSKFLKNDFYGTINLKIGLTKIIIIILDQNNISYENIQMFGTRGKVQITDDENIQYYNIKKKFSNNFSKYNLKFFRKINYDNALKNFYYNYIKDLNLNKFQFSNDSLFIKILKEIDKK